MITDDGFLSEGDNARLLGSLVSLELEEIPSRTSNQ